MLVFSVTVLILLHSLSADSLGTSTNHFEFVELGAHGGDSGELTSGTYDYLEYWLNPRVNFGYLQSWESVNVDINGNVFFGIRGDEQFTYEGGFSSYSEPAFIIAPFWDDMNIGPGGHVRYEFHNNQNSQGNLLDDVGQYIHDVLGDSITVSSLLIVEWKNMRSNVLGTDATNTFQLLIASSDSLLSQSYAIFTYKCGELGWSTAYSTIGFKSDGNDNDNRYTYRNHPFSQYGATSPNPIACINQPNSVWSNVVYQIDGYVLSCSSDQFGCTDGICLQNVRCNGNMECPDGTDEIGCSSPTIPTCTSDQFMCVNRGCVSRSLTCNGHWDCTDGSDEMACFCLADRFECDTGACISANYRCDGEYQCPYPDESDEAGCPTHHLSTPTPTVSAHCGSNQFTCTFVHQCISSSKRCDGIADCSDGSDELNCGGVTSPPGTCGSNQFTCTVTQQCISSSLRCNGVPECSDATDEVNCGTTGICAANEFTCKFSHQCVSSSARCNGRADCNDGSDESIDCGGVSSSAALGTGAIVGIVVTFLFLGTGCVCIIAIVIVVAVVMYKRKTRTVQFQRFDSSSESQQGNTARQSEYNPQPPPQYTQSGGSGQQYPTVAYSTRPAAPSALPVQSEVELQGIGAPIQGSGTEQSTSNTKDSTPSPCTSEDALLIQY